MAWCRSGRRQQSITTPPAAITTSAHGSVSPLAAVLELADEVALTSALSSPRDG